MHVHGVNLLAAASLCKTRAHVSLIVRLGFTRHAFSSLHVPLTSHGRDAVCHALGAVLEGQPRDVEARVRRHVAHVRAAPPVHHVELLRQIHLQRRGVRTEVRGAPRQQELVDARPLTEANMAWARVVAEAGHGEPACAAAAAEAARMSVFIL